jgi:hypothetical protein
MKKTVKGDQMQKPNFKELADRWPSAWVARQEVDRFTGGIISEKYIANLDSRGMGIQDRVRCGRKICYKVDSLISWLESRSKSVN